MHNSELQFAQTMTKPKKQQNNANIHAKMLKKEQKLTDEGFEPPISCSVGTRVIQLR